MNYWERQQLEKKQLEEWVSTLKVGDEVAIRGGRWNYQKWYVYKIVKITPTGRLNLENGGVVMPDGYLRGDSFNRIYPVTEEVKYSIWKAKAIRKIERELKVEELPEGDLRVLLTMLRSQKERNDSETN